jgi:SAM-dependent methyltransferase
MSAPSCRTCGASDAKLLGALPDGRIFAGQHLANALPGGSLWRCPACGFAFRYPLLGERVYEDLYRNGALGIWDSEQRREDFRLIREQILLMGSAQLDVADIGCYTGQLLTSLPQSCRTFGVEPNKEAARVASDRGVTIIAESMDQFVAAGTTYDVITACDVIEHLPNPLQFLAELRRKLKPGGRIIITTGNCDAWLWRSLGSKYWYCRFPEHISFIGTEWVGKMAFRAQLRLTRAISFNYRGGGTNIARVVATLLNRMSPGLYEWLRRRRGNRDDGAVPPGIGAIRDHMLCVFEAV